MDMDSSGFAFAAEFMRSHGTPYEAGLSDAEFDRVEAEFELAFPPDLRAFLAIGLPVGESFGAATSLLHRTHLSRL